MTAPGGVTGLYRDRLAALKARLLAWLAVLWFQQFDPARPAVTLAVIGAAAGDVIGGAQQAAAVEAAAWLRALVAERAAAALFDISPFAVPPVAGTSLSGRSLLELTGLAPAVFLARVNAGLSEAEAAAAASAWLNRVAASEPYRAANLTTLENAQYDDRLTGRVSRVTRPGACDFCGKIADRGYIPAHAGFAAHAHCQCTASPEISSRVYSRRAMARAAAATRVARREGRSP